MHFYLSRKLLLAWQARGRQIDWVEIGLWHKFQFSWRFFWQNCVRNDFFMKKMWCKIVQEILGTLPSGVDDRVTGQGKQRIEVFWPLQRVAMKSYMCYPWRKFATRCHEKLYVPSFTSSTKLLSGSWAKSRPCMSYMSMMWGRWSEVRAMRRHQRKWSWTAQLRRVLVWNIIQGFKLFI